MKRLTPPQIGDVESLPIDVDPAISRAAMKLRRQIAATRRTALTTNKKPNQVVSAALKAMNGSVAALERQKDPFEQAKSYLARRVPVFSAAVYDPDFDERTAKRLIDCSEWVVGGVRLPDRAAVMELARSAGWAG